MTGATIIYVMGVSGCGKSTIGQLLAKRMDLPFFDGDDFHLPENIEKMAKGTPLNDDDRKEWLGQLNELAKKHSEKGAVIACSALKKNYRLELSTGIPEKTCFVYLEGSFEQVLDRVKRREGHFMPATLLKSQFNSLEPPEKAISVSIQQTPESIVNAILQKLH